MLTKGLDDALAQNLRSGRKPGGQSAGGSIPARMLTALIEFVPLRCKRGLLRNLRLQRRHLAVQNGNRCLRAQG